jgi:branched-chain amino acid transport system ATP-binding protein
LLDVEQIEVAYGKARAVNGATVRVAPGSITAIVGPNGAGKTSLLKAVSGLQPIRAGQIRFRGERIDALADREVTARGIAHIREGRRVFAKMTVLENLQLGAYLRSDRAEVAQAFESVFEAFPRLRERQGQRAGSLSGGEQQMLTVARTLMGNPRVLLLDEPSEGLAPVIVRALGDQIAALKREGLTILLSEQNLKFAARLADRAYIIEKGEIRFEGPMAALMGDEALRRKYLTV